MTKTATKAPTLRACDRCDRCSAQARVRVVTKAGDLDFCKHHFEQHEAALAPVMLALIDDREFIP